MKRTDPQFKLRIPEDLKARLEEAATSEGRSVTAEIIQRLEESFPQYEEMLIATRSRELETIAMARRIKEDEFKTLLGWGNEKWEDAYREYARLRILESAIQNEIEGFSSFSSDIKNEVEEEIALEKERLKSADTRNYSLTRSGKKSLLQKPHAFIKKGE